MIQNFVPGTLPMVNHVNAVEAALGLPLSSPGRTVVEAWDAIAAKCGLPLNDPFDPFDLNAFSTNLWNAAVRIANQRANV